MTRRNALLVVAILAGVAAPAPASAAVSLTVAPADPGTGAVTGAWSPLSAGAVIGDVGSHAVGTVGAADVRVDLRVPGGDGGPLPRGCVASNDAGPTDLGSFGYVATGTYVAEISAYPAGSGCRGTPERADVPFTFADASSVTFVGTPRAGERTAATPLRGVRAVVPPGPGTPVLRCALDPVAGADGEPDGSQTRDRDELEVADADLFDRAGRWGCAARKRLGGGRFTPWSPLVAADVLARFLPRPFSLIDSYATTRRARFRVRVGADAAAAGGTVRVTLRRCTFKPRAGDRRRRPRVSVTATTKLVAARGPDGAPTTSAGTVAITLPFPLRRYIEVYEVRVAFSGGRFVPRTDGLRVAGAELLALQREPRGRAYATLERPPNRRACSSYSQTTKDPFHDDRSGRP